MKSLKQLCFPRDSVFDAKRRDTVLNLMHLAQDNINGKSFIEENWVPRLYVLDPHKLMRSLEDTSILTCA